MYVKDKIETVFAPASKVHSGNGIKSRPKVHLKKKNSRKNIHRTAQHHILKKIYSQHNEPV